MKRVLNFARARTRTLRQQAFSAALFACLCLWGAARVRAEAPTYVLLRPQFAAAPLAEEELEELRSAVHTKLKQRWHMAPLSTSDDIERAAADRSALEQGARNAQLAPLILEVQCADKCRVGVRGGPDYLAATVRREPQRLGSWLKSLRGLKPSADPGSDGLLLGAGSSGAKTRAFHVTVQGVFGRKLPRDRASALLAPLEAGLAQCDREGAFVLRVAKDGSVSDVNTELERRGQAPSCLARALSQLKLPGGAMTLLGRVTLFERGGGDSPRTVATASTPASRSSSVRLILPTAEEYGTNGVAEPSLDAMFRNNRDAIERCGTGTLEVEVSFMISPKGDVRSLIVEGAPADVQTCLEQLRPGLHALPPPGQDLHVHVRLRWR